ncbi:MAG: hypothetical protein ACRDCG_02010 [Mycoplasmoidaceae bacterium]
MKKKLPKNINFNNYEKILMMKFSDVEKEELSKEIIKFEKWFYLYDDFICDNVEETHFILEKSDKLREDIIIENSNKENILKASKNLINNMIVIKDVK